MLHQGVVYDPQIHPKESAPATEQLSIADITARAVRRHALDGTPYCACCDTVLRTSRDAGAPKALCTECFDARRTEAQRQSDQRRQVEARAVRSGAEPWLGLSVRDVEDLSELIDHLTNAVGRASSHFKSQDSQTWQHELLLASKQLVIWRDDRLA